MKLDALQDPVEHDEVDAILEQAGELYSNDHIYRVEDWLETVSGRLRDVEPAVRERARTWARIEARLERVDGVWEVRKRLRSRGALPVRFLVVWDGVEIVLP